MRDQIAEMEHAHGDNLNELRVRFSTVTVATVVPRLLSLWLQLASDRSAGPTDRGYQPLGLPVL
jgi:hypothetical protein